MKKKLHFFLLLISFYSFSQGVGIGTKNPDVSSILDVTSNNKGFLPPVMSQNQLNHIDFPASGLLVYCLDCTNEKKGCLVVNDGDKKTPQWNCIGTSSSTSSSLSVVPTGFNRSYYLNNTLINDTFKVTLVNNSFSPVNIDLSTSDLTFGGRTDISVVSVVPTSITNLASGGTAVVTYNLSGTPKILGPLVGNWQKLNLQTSSSTNILQANTTEFTYTGTISYLQFQAE